MIGLLLQSHDGYVSFIRTNKIIITTSQKLIEIFILHFMGNEFQQNAFLSRNKLYLN